MKFPIRLTGSLASLAVAGLLSTLSAQTPPIRRVAPQDQAAELRASTDGLYNKKLAPTEEALRNDIVLLRDSLDVVVGFANRLERATATNMPSVAASAIKELSSACAAASRTAIGIRPRMQALQILAADRTQQQRTTKVLNEYRSAFDAVTKLMTSCEREAATMAKSKAPSPTQMGAYANKVSTAIHVYEATMRNTLNDFDIPLRPKQQAGR